MAALLLELGPGDEVIMPSFTFSSTANAFVLRGATPVFVDVRADTMNIDERLIEEAITPRTKAICVVHYAGVGCNMDPIMACAERHGLQVIEDAAQAILCKYNGKALGTFGVMGTLSFHESKNVISGEGGSLLINERSYVDRAAIIREKGTNRTAFSLGKVDRYTWMDLGSSYLPSELIAAMLYAQFEVAEDIISRRLQKWELYHCRLLELEQRGIARRPVVPEGCLHNGHIYFLITESRRVQEALTERLKKNNIKSASHYVPLHSSPAGRRFGRAHGELRVTEDQSERLLRLPLWSDLPVSDLEYVCDEVLAFFGVSTGVQPLLRSAR
jgi:dTDP-4-amino-4,6-dideoxygalactose transaminase